MTAYKIALINQLTYHKVKDKLRMLQEATEHGVWSSELKEVYKKLDRTITEVMIHAENISTPTIKKAYEWSPAQPQSTYEIKYWELRIKILKGFPVNPTVLSAVHYKTRLSSEHTKSMSMAALVENLRTTRDCITTQYYSSQSPPAVTQSAAQAI